MFVFVAAPRRPVAANQIFRQSKGNTANHTTWSRIMDPVYGNEMRVPVLHNCRTCLHHYVELVNLRAKLNVFLIPWIYFICPSGKRAHRKHLGERASHQVNHRNDHKPAQVCQYKVWQIGLLRLITWPVSQHFTLPFNHLPATPCR